eukprot:scaffold2012_cov228-Pinguiococcus_pyrenoidosus.AAC.4
MNELRLRVRLGKNQKADCQLWRPTRATTTRALVLLTVEEAASEAAAGTAPAPELRLRSSEPEKRGDGDAAPSACSSLASCTRAEPRLKDLKIRSPKALNMAVGCARSKRPARRPVVGARRASERQLPR